MRLNRPSSTKNVFSKFFWLGKIGKQFCFYIPSFEFYRKKKLSKAHDFSCILGSIYQGQLDWFRATDLGHLSFKQDTHVCSRFPGKNEGQVTMAASQIRGNINETAQPDLLHGTMLINSIIEKSLRNKITGGNWWWQDPLPWDPYALRRGTCFAWKSLCNVKHCLLGPSQSAASSSIVRSVSSIWHLPLFHIMHPSRTD